MDSEPEMTNDRKQALKNLKSVDGKPAYYIATTLSENWEQVKAALSQPTPQELCDKIVERLGAERKCNTFPDKIAENCYRSGGRDMVDKAIEIVKEVCGDN